MIYRDFQGIKLSGLGMGCMRLPVVDGKDDQVNQAAVEEMVACAMDSGVNYYDTAWGYHGGNSEIRQGPGGLSPEKLLSGGQIPRLRPVQYGQGGGNL